MKKANKMTKLDYVVFMFAGIIVWAMLFIKDLDSYTKGTIFFIVAGLLHVLSSNSLSRMYNNNWIPFAPKTSPTGVKMIGVIAILIGIGVWLFK